MSKTVTDLDRADYVIDGKQAEKLNGLCKSLNAIKKEIAPLDAERKDITNNIKELLQDTDGITNAGTYVTSQYGLLITRTPEKLTIDADKLAKDNPELFKELAMKYPKITKEVIALKKVEKR